ncbi:MAG: hypothetical protein ACREUK_07250 [Burkholderiales bacterium]
MPFIVVDGMDVFFIDPDASRDQVRERLTAGLAHLKQYDPRRYNLVHQQIRHILIWPGHYHAYTRLGGILLAAEHIQDAMLAETIGSLVHEAVHLRIERWGARTGGDRQARIERRCLAEQVDSLLRCSLISPETGQKIMAILSIEWWTTAAHRRDVQQLMLKAGLPLWVARLLVPFEFGRGAK